MQTAGQSPAAAQHSPVTGMAIAHGHKHVDMSGLVHVPSLAQWDASTSSVVMAIMEMCSLFSAQPPLRARPTVPVAASPAGPAGAGSGYGHGPSYQPVQPSVAAGGGSVSAVGGGQGGWGGPTPVPSPAVGGITRQHSMDSEVEKARYRAKLTGQIQEEMRVLLQSMGRDIDKEYELQGELERNSQRLQQHKDAIAAHNAALVAHEADMTAYLEEVSLQVATSERQTINSATAPGLVGPGDVLSKQLLDTVAEAAAIEDAYGVLAKALEEGILPTDVFVRECRRRARRQFELKCLANTIHTAQARQHTLAQPQAAAMPPHGGFAAAAARSTAPAASGGLVYHSGSVPPAHEQEWVVVGQQGQGRSMYPPHK